MLRNLSRPANLSRLFEQLISQTKELSEWIKKLALEIAQTYAMLVQKNFDVERIFLYGSYAKGTPNQNSDIDIAVVVDDIEGDYLAQQAKLFKLRRAIDLRIEPVLLLNNRDDSGFVSEIMATGEVIYSSSDV